METNTSKVHEPASESLLTGSGAGSPLFVINLCASIAPVQVPSKALPGLESYRLYQVARMEDGRTRHRLRLGFFTDENEAGMVLASVREQYPTAFTTCLGDDDHKFARGYVSAAATRPAARKPVALAASSAKSAAVKPTPDIAASPHTAAIAAKPQSGAATQVMVEATRPMRQAGAVEISREAPKAAVVAKPVTAKADPVQTPAAKAAPAAAASEASHAKRDEIRLAPSQSAIELTLEPELRPSVPAASMQPAQPFHVGKGVDIPDVTLNLEADAKSSMPQLTPAAANKPAVASKPALASKPELPKSAPLNTKAPIAKPTWSTNSPIAATATAAPAAPFVATRPSVIATSRGLDMQLPELDSTQTIRALTSSELSDDSQEKWFAIQLAVSDQPVNLDAMPRLDIFEAYSLYSVATAGSGKIVHSLRLGFFREAVSAEAVSGYLKTFFGTPSVLRISVAEQLRFKDAPTWKTPAGAAKPESNVVALNARERNPPVIPTVTVEVTPRVDSSASGSFKPNSSGSFKAHSTGSFKPNDTGSFKPSATGSHAASKVAAKSAVATRSASATKSTSTGKFRAMRKPTLQEQLLEEAREVELSESAIRKLPKSGSLLARLVGKLTK